MSTQLQSIAIIPARGGSKRLHRKNIRLVNGKPLLSYPICSALSSGCFDKVIVSSDDHEILGIGADNGAETFLRDTSLSNDMATVDQVCLDVLSHHNYLSSYSFCCIYPTSIFLTSDDFVASMNILDEETDFVMGVSNYNFHPFQAMKVENSYLKQMWPEYDELKSQQYPEMYVSNGSLYWAKTEVFKKEKTFYGNRLKGFAVDTIDINNEDDLINAQSRASCIGLKIT